MIEMNWIPFATPVPARYYRNGDAVVELILGWLVLHNSDGYIDEIMYLSSRGLVFSNRDISLELP